MIKKYSRYPSTMRFSTYYNNNQNEAGIYTASIKNMRAEKKTSTAVLITWEMTPYNPMAPYIIYRSLMSGGAYEMISSGNGTSFLDDISMYKGNDFIEYKVESLSADAGVQLYMQADDYMYGLADQYIWQLRNTETATKAVAYCLASSEDYCPECYSSELKKRVKSKCATCDGSGKMARYSGPIPMLYALRVKERTMEMVGNVERDKEMMSAWTGNIPILNIGDIIINKDHDKYIVQEIPKRIMTHALKTNDEFVIRQDMVLRKIDNEYYPLFVYVEQSA